MSSSSTHIRINLAPRSGFCIKSTTLTPAVLPPPPPTPSAPNANLLEPAPGPIPISKGLKVFVNLAWDPNVPPPPEGSEDAIQRAMQGEDVDEANPHGWYVPVIVSNPRQDKDKSGNPSLVFDCIFNTSVKSRTLRDPDFKIFLIELALQRIEAQTGLTLSRDIGTPNIASKGKLLPRSVQVPASMVPALTGTPSVSSKGSANTSPITSKTNGSTPLIQEISLSTTPPEHNNGPEANNSIDPRVSASTITTVGNRSSDSALPGLRGILKKPAATPSRSSSAIASDSGTTTGIADQEAVLLQWAWMKDDSGRLRIDVYVPGLTHELVQNSTLDIEPRRLILSIPNRPTLDIDLSLSDAEIAARVATMYASLSSSKSAKSKSQDEESSRRKEEETTRTLQLKRQRDFDVDGAEAEWKVGTDMVTIYV